MAIMVMGTLAPVGPHGRVLCRLIIRCPDAVLAASLASPALLPELSRSVTVLPCACKLKLCMALHAGKPCLPVPSSMYAGLL